MAKVKSLPPNAKSRRKNQQSSIINPFYIIPLVVVLVAAVSLYSLPSSTLNQLKLDADRIIHQYLPSSLASFLDSSNQLQRHNVKHIPVTQYSLLEIFANHSMDWKISTTPIPISSPSVVLKAILSKNMEKIPEELKYLAYQDTVPINVVRQYLNRARYPSLAEGLCGGDNRKECQKWVNYADPEFGITPLHLASAAGDFPAIDFLKSLGANPQLMDTAGRKPANMSFTSFVENSKKFARAAGRKDCDIPVVDVKSPEDFKEIRRLVNEGEPVLIKNVLKHLHRGRDLSEISLSEMVSKFGESKVTVGEVPYADVFRLPHAINTLKDYYDNHVLKKSPLPLYIFQKNANITDMGLEALSDLVLRAFPTPDLICPVEYGDTGSDSIHFFLGAENSGAPFHIHADAANLVVHGGKRWFLYPPLQAVYSRKHISKWLVEDYKEMKEEARPLECRQGPGDVIYVPFDWSHAVLNTEDQTFGFALELLNRREVMVSLPSLYQSCANFGKKE